MNESQDRNLFVFGVIAFVFMMAIASLGKVLFIPDIAWWQFVVVLVIFIAIVILELLMPTPKTTLDQTISEEEKP